MSSITINFDAYGRTLTTRDLCKTIRGEIEKYIKEGKKVRIDLSKIDLMTSGFSDEVFGVLFESLGGSEFKNSFLFSFPIDEGKKKLIQALIGRALNDRMKRQSN